MKTSLWLVPLILMLVCAAPLRAGVTITEREDRIEVKIGDRLFTEWRHREWVAPFLYPVIGPNGENVTRHFPMKPGMPGEDPDHPWHRSIRFSHSDVNGFNFWWAPGKERAGHTAEVKLEKIEKLVSGETGELELWNRWLGDGKLVLREQVRLAFLPQPNGELLMDCDITLQAADAPVVFGDKRDGGLLVRVAGTMKVEDEKGNPGSGTILNSRGDRNTDAWGKRAEWTDYSGPDATGKTVGIALFDHPSNLRFPTHWHARTYGLMTANRFGTDHFKGNYDDHKTVICAPSKGANCAACASHTGDYTLAAGQSLTLRHRFYFHHGDALQGAVGRRYDDYAGDRDSTVIRMRVMFQDRKWKELIEKYGAEDFASWPAGDARQASEALQVRGQTYSFTKDGPRAEADLLAARKLAPDHPDIVLLLAENYVNNLDDESKAIASFRDVIALTGTNNQGWQPLTATVGLARLYTGQVKLDAALEVLKPYGDLSQLPSSWRIRLLRAYGHLYAAQGREQESLSKFREALELEAQP
jgi:predicted negative regulator of RcsB-dependent stress response